MGYPLTVDTKALPPDYLAEDFLSDNMFLMPSRIDQIL
jgi:hypothetical protein